MHLPRIKKHEAATHNVSEPRVIIMPPQEGTMDKLALLDIPLGRREVRAATGQSYRQCTTFNRTIRRLKRKGLATSIFNLSSCEGSAFTVTGSPRWISHALSSLSRLSKDSNM